MIKYKREKKMKAKFPLLSKIATGTFGKNLIFQYYNGLKICRKKGQRKTKMTIFRATK